MINKNLKYYGIGALAVLGLILIGVFSNAAYGLFIILISIFFANLDSAINRKKKWNHGICKETNKPWDIYDMIDYGDGSWEYEFKSGDEYLCIGPNDYINKEFCGKHFTKEFKIN